MISMTTKGTGEVKEFKILKWRMRKPLNKKELKRMYWKEEMTSVEIAKVFNVNPTHVRSEMKRHGIKRRNRFEAWDIRRKYLGKVKG